MWSEECARMLGSGPKVKSQATVLWRQTRGLRLVRGTRKEERDMFNVSLGFAAFTKALAD